MMWPLVLPLVLYATGRRPLVMPGVTSSVENSLFFYDAFPELPQLGKWFFAILFGNSDHFYVSFGDFAFLAVKCLKTMDQYMART